MSYNLFAYCKNNPVMGNDPTGHFSWKNVFNTAAVVTITALAVIAIVGSGGAAAPPLLAAASALAGTTVTAAAATTVAAGVAAVGIATMGAAVTEGILESSSKQGKDYVKAKTSLSMVRRFQMDSIPQIRLVFILTKNDSADFDREAVTQSLCIVPSKTSAPRLSKGELSCDVADINGVEAELSGITILPAASPPYQMLLHAYWSIELPKIECWDLDEPLQQLEQILCRKESEVLHVCQDYNLSADLIVRVFAESNNMPVLKIPSSSVSFWASMGVSIGFDFYLD